MIMKVAVALLLLTTAAAVAGPNCTAEPKSRWLDEAAFREKIAGLGYAFKSVKVSGSCYEIYGRDKNGRRVDVYFDPITAQVVEEHKG